MSKGSARPRSKTRVRVRSGIWLGLPIEEAGQGWKQSLPVGEAGQSQKAGAVPLWPDLSLGGWFALLSLLLGFWAGPGVARCLLGQAFVGKPVHEGPQVYEPNTS